MKINDIRSSEFNKLDSLYFSTAYHGPIPNCAYNAGLKALDRERNPSFLPYEEWKNLSDLGRDSIAMLLGCSSDNIAHSTSTSELISHVVNGYSFEPESVVIQMQNEFPSDVLPWILLKDKLNVKHQFISESFFLEPNKNLNLLPQKTKVIHASLVRFDTGTMINALELSKICKDRGILFILDTTQAFGGMPIDKELLKNVDILVNSTYKWCLGPYGHAFAYFSDQILNSINATHISWLNVVPAKSGSLTEYSTEFCKGARKFDRGQTANLVQMSSLIGSLDLLNRVGLNSIYEHNKNLACAFVSGIDRKKFNFVTNLDYLSNIVCIGPIDKNKIDFILTNLKSANIDCTVREGNLRFSFHLFNTSDEVSKLIDLLNKA